MKTILITGAGTGIGKATSIKMAKEGFQVILVGRRVQPLEDVYEQLQGVGHEILSVDVSDKNALHMALNAGLMKGRDLVGVFANAGIGGANEYGDKDRWEQIININLSGAYYTIMECLPFLRVANADYKHILLTSSCLARFGVPNYTAYCASKSGLNGLTRALAIELADDQILVNSILPGWVDTEMARAGIQLLADDKGQSYDETYLQEMDAVPLKKMSRPEELANLVSFLFGQEQASMTGQCIDVNNGSFMV